MRTPATTIGLALLLHACAAFAGTQDESTHPSIPTNMELLEEVVHELVDAALDSMPLAAGDVVLVRSSEYNEISWIVEDYLAGRLTALGVSAYLDLTAPQPSQGASSPGETEARPKGRRPGRRDTTGTAAGGEPLSGRAPFASQALDDTASTPEEPGAGVEKDSGGGVAAEERKPEGLFGRAPVPDKVLDLRITELEVDYTRRWRKSLFGSAMVERSARGGISFRLLDGADGRVLWTDTDRREKKDIVPQGMLSRLEDIPSLSPSAESGGRGITRVLEPVIVSGIVVGLVLLFYSSRT